LDSVRRTPVVQVSFDRAKEKDLPTLQPVGTQAKHIPKALWFFGQEILGNNFIVHLHGSVSITLFFCLLSIFLNPVRL
jgi:uncharacterized membrane protein YagU involved in acid resistance